MSAATERYEKLAPWIAGLLLASPTLVTFYPPMTDLPFHEAAIGLLRHLGDARLVPPGLYRLNLGQPNQLFYVVGWALSYVVSTRWAVKLLVAGAIVALPVSTARFARSIGGSPLSALLVAPMALGWLFSWGLITNLIGLSALLWSLPVVDRHAEAPTRKTTAAALGCIVLMYFAHEAMMFMLAAATLMLAALHPLSWRKTLLRLAPLGLAVAATVAQILVQKHLLSPALRAMPRLWHPVSHKIARIPYIILPTTEALVQNSMAALCAIAIGYFLWLRYRERTAARLAAPARSAASATPGPWLVRARTWLRERRWWLFVTCCFAGYLLLPYTLNGATLVYQRWFPPAFAVFVAVSAPRDLGSRAARVARLAAFLLPVATLLVVWPSFVDSGRAYKTFDDLVARVEPGSAVAVLGLGPGDPWRTFSLGPAGGRILATRGGRLAYAFTDSPVSPVVIPRAYRWNESLLRIGFDSWAFRPEHDLESFRYVIVRHSDPRGAALAMFMLQPEARYVADAGEWVLFESTLPVIPPNSPPIHMPKPPPESLRDRAKRIVESMHKDLDVPAPAAEEPDVAGPNGQHF